jgi:enoyl-CoA hydratase/carnithine racemase
MSNEHASSSGQPADGSPIKVDIHEGVATLTLDRPKQRNPLSAELLQHAPAALDALEADKEVRAVVLTGAGTVFCAGAQLGTVLHPDGLDGEWQLTLLRGFNRLAQRIRELDLPVIAAVNGPAVGGGAALALACDFAVAAPEASYYFAFGRVGAAGADLGCAWLLPKIVGELRARHWLLTGATVGAEEGRAAGLFIEVCPRDKLVARAQELARQVAEAAPRRAAAATKFAISRASEADLNSVLGYEAYIQSYLFTTPEHKERLGAFLAGRKSGPK